MWTTEPGVLLPQDHARLAAATVALGRNHAQLQPASSAHGCGPETKTAHGATLRASESGEWRPPSLRVAPSLPIHTHTNTHTHMLYVSGDTCIHGSTTKADRRFWMLPVTPAPMGAPSPLAPRLVARSTRACDITLNRIDA